MGLVSKISLTSWGLGQAFGEFAKHYAHWVTLNLDPRASQKVALFTDLNSGCK